MAKPFLGAIAAVTTKLRDVLEDSEIGLPSVLPDVTVTTKPPEHARKGVKGNQANIYLYQLMANAQYRNAPDKQGQFPIALDMFYLFTFYGGEDNAVFGQKLMERTMQIFHDAPGIEVKLMQRLVKDGEPLVERLRVIPQYYTLDELSKFWTSAGAGFRLSLIYMITVLLIEPPSNL